MFIYRTVFRDPVKNHLRPSVNVRPSQITLLGPLPTPWVLPVCICAYIVFKIILPLLLWSHFYKPIKLLFSSFDGFSVFHYSFYRLAFTHYCTFQIIPFFFFYYVNNTALNISLSKSLQPSGIISFGWTPVKITGS